MKALQLLDQHLERIALPRQIWYGSMPNPRMLKPVETDILKAAKPVGGIWTADYEPISGSTWKQFLDTNSYDDRLTGASRNKAAALWEVTPKANSRVLNIDTQQQLDQLPLVKAANWYDPDVVDYGQLKREYDGMRINTENLDHLEQENLGMGSLINSWDVPSTVWFGNRGFPFSNATPLRR